MESILENLRRDHELTPEIVQRVEEALVSTPPTSVGGICPICYEDVIYTTPDPDSNRYTHLMCCSERICDTCSSKMTRRGTCPFCNQRVLDLILEGDEHVILNLYVCRYF